MHILRPSQTIKRSPAPIFSIFAFSFASSFASSARTLCAISLSSLAALMLMNALPAIGQNRSAADSPSASTSPHPRLNNLKVLSDHIEDTTTPENILKSFVKPGMTDAARARAIWTASVKYRHQTAPPNEYLSGEWEAHDPSKIFNVYGYCMCCCSSLLEALNRLDGRTFTINASTNAEPEMVSVSYEMR